MRRSSWVQRCGYNACKVSHSKVLARYEHRGNNVLSQVLRDKQPGGGWSELADFEAQVWSSKTSLDISRT